MKSFLRTWVLRRGRLLLTLLPATGLLAALPACRSDAARLVRLEAAQVQQARELAILRQQLADKDKEVAQLEQCVGDLEGAMYEDPDSVATDEERPAGPVVL